MSGDDVASNFWLATVESGSDQCPFGGKWYEDTWPNPWVPRVTRCLGYGCCVKTMGVHGVRPPDLPHYVTPLYNRLTNAPTPYDLTYNPLQYL
jgi:hypothetical protein